MKILAAVRILVIIRLSQNTIIQTKLVIGKIKDETGSVAIKKFVRLKTKTYLFLVDNSEHKKTKGVNKNVVETISHKEYKDVLLKNKSTKFHCLVLTTNIYPKQRV